MGTYPATGVTLLVHKYKGTQRLASFYTRERGKVEATVSGVGKPGSKLAPAVEPLVLSRLYFAEGRNLDRLTQCEVVESFYELRQDLQRLSLAAYAAELVARTTEPGHRDPELFDALVHTLSALTVSAQPELVTWGFALRYLCLHGIGPVLDECGLCGQSEHRTWRYVDQMGGLVCDACNGPQGLPILPQVRAALRSLLQLPPERVDRLRLNPGMQEQIRQLLRRHIRYHVGVELRSEQFMEKMARAGRTAGDSE